MTDQPSITCPLCGKISYHPDDIDKRYCGGGDAACHIFWGDLADRQRTAAMTDEEVLETLEAMRVPEATLTAVRQRGYLFARS